MEVGDDVVVTGVGLFHQDLASPFLKFCPGFAAPCVVGPAQAEGEVGLAAVQHLVEGAFQQLAAVAEPVMPVAETLDAGLTGQLGLPLAHHGVKQVVVAQLARHLGLDVAFEERFGPPDVCPLGESLAPPLVVLRNLVELWQIKGDYPRFFIHLVQVV